MDSKQIFFTKYNYNILFSVLKDNFNNINNNDINNILNKSMLYVYENNKVIKKNKNQQLFDMNKEVINLVSPILKKKINEKKNIGDNISNIIFDDSITSEHVLPNIMEYPKLDIKQTNIEDSVKKLSEERNLINPTIKNIDFTDNNKNDNLENIANLYNKIINNRNEIDDSVIIKENYNNKEIYNDILTKQNTPIKNISYENNIILPPKVQEEEQTIFIIIDSQDRDFAIYPYPTNFKVKFSPSSNSIKYNSIVDENNNTIYETKTIYYGEKTASLPDIIDNIVKISCTSILVPTSYNYIGGRNPVKFDKATTLLTDPPQVQNNYASPYTGRYTVSTGIPISIFNEPYLLLNIDELTNTYYGTNNQSNKAFAKFIIPYQNNYYSVSSKFINCYTSNDQETIYYKPTSQSKIDKMTLTLNNKNGKLLNFGIDILYIEEISRGNLKYNKECDKFYNTKIKIANKNKYYLNYCNEDTIYSHTICPGDLIYIYNTIPSDDNIVYFNKNLHIINLELINDFETYTNQTFVKITMHFCNEFYDNKNRCGLCNNDNTVNFRNIFPDNNNTQYYIYLSNIYYKVYGFIDNDVVIKVSNNFNIDMNISSIGFTKSNLSGFNSDEDNSLLSNNGYYVTNVGNMNYNGDTDITDDNNFWYIEINYPYEYIKDKFFNNGDLFIVQQKLQISYTFKIDYLTRNYKILDSNLN